MPKIQKPKKEEYPRDPREKINPKEVRASYLERMESHLEKKGVVFFDADSNLNINGEFLELPGEITDIPSRDLGEYLNAFTQQKVYLRTLLGRVILEAEEARREYYDASADLYRKYSLEKMSETAKERIINQTPSVKPSYNKYADFKKHQELIEFSIANIEDIIFMLSREVSRRTGDWNEENRSYNVNRR